MSWSDMHRNSSDKEKEESERERERRVTMRDRRAVVMIIPASYHCNDNYVGVHCHFAIVTRGYCSPRIINYSVASRYRLVIKLKPASGRQWKY
ncbi:hypothetical protein J6590_001355 [Homalodisca vitripennis]|nr:hypothetical protein J6590_001355 [Homalodisca vitripennis]